MILMQVFLLQVLNMFAWYETLPIPTISLEQWPIASLAMTHEVMLKPVLKRYASQASTELPS